MKKNNKISLKLQTLCFDIMDVVNQYPGISISSILSSFPNTQKVMVSTALNLLYDSELITPSVFGNGYETNPLIPDSEWMNKIKNLEFKVGSEIYSEYKRLSAIQPYQLPTNMSVQIRELKMKEYIQSKEFLDYESMTLIEKNGEFFLSRQFGSLFANETGEKRLNVYIAEAENNSILGIVAIGNFTSDHDLDHKLPCENSEIYNINFIATRKGTENKGIATNLLKYAIKEVTKENSIKVLCYNPICDQSASVMKKVFPKNKYNLHKWEDNEYDLDKYGSSLQGYIITKKSENISEMESFEV